MHYYPHHIGDYQRDTAHLSATDHGVYRLLMDHYYVTEKPLTGDIPTLCRVVRAVTKTERDSVLRVVSLFFQASDKGFTHKRIEAEIAEYRKKSEVAAAAGKASGEARRAKRNANEKGTDVERTFDSRSHSVPRSVEPTSNQEPVTSVLLEKEPKEQELVLLEAKVDGPEPQFTAVYALLDDDEAPSRLNSPPRPPTDLEMKIIRLFKTEGSNRPHAPFAASEKRNIAALRKRLGDKTIMEDLEMMAKAKAKGWPYYSQKRPTLLNNWDDQVRMATTFMQSVAPADRYNGLNPQRGKV